MRQLKSLNVFLAVVEYGTFAAAAEHVFLTPAAVGQQIKALEDDLGFSLFDRTSNSIALNHRGHRFALTARTVVDILNEAKWDQDTNEIVGSMRISSISTAMPVLVRAIISMRRDYPKVYIDPKISYSTNLKQKVLTGEVDGVLTVRAVHDRSDDVLWTPLYEEPFAFVFNKKDSGKNIQAILEKNIFFQSAPDTKTGIIIKEIMKASDLAPKDCIVMDAVRSIFDLVQEGLGVSVLPIPLVFLEKNYPDIRLEYFEGPHASRVVGFMENSRNTVLSSILRSQLLRQAKLFTDPRAI